MRFGHFLPVAALMLGGLVAHADTFTTFQLQAALDNGYGTGTAGSVGGSFTVDVTTGVVTALNLQAMTTAANNIGLSSASFTTVGSQQYDIAYGEYAVISHNGSATLSLEFNNSSLVGYSGGNLCTNASAGVSCGNGSDYSSASGGVHFASGSVTPQAATTPEPSSLALLGTGMLGVVGILRRRFA